MYKKLAIIFLLIAGFLCYGEEKKLDYLDIKLDFDKQCLTITDTRQEHYLKVTSIKGSVDELKIIYNALNCADDCINLNLADLGFSTAVSRGISQDPETGDAISETYILLCNDLEIDD